ncbi:hypothetical protein J4E83_007752 [Alternaria metachromatica]|uniref:uncharacterized protein n=1 Tax=Alternaria metachromatica TaxID=283354 RepID=UPI0020C3E8CD|nr:uncharacterized protein J4E83_007752 [Alternaria metachromatica]KAI4612201.1 hypothetical protein J4E83_007752 [Alternaria metachromatica]
MYLSQRPETALVDIYTGISRDLVAAWPTAQDLDYICKLPVSISTHMHMKLTTSSANLMNQVPDSPGKILQLPPPGSHPVLIARKLLLLSNIVQGALSDDCIPRSQREHLSKVMAHAMDTATRLVTSNDELTASVEGVECIMIEAITQNYAGNLHRAWLTVRRAVAVAQMLGLHRGNAKRASIKVVDPKTRESLDPDQLCCRIVEMDRYLSLTLGLPQSSLQTVGLSAEVIAKCHPLDRIARLQCVIGDRILARKVGEPRDITEKRVREIDDMFREVTELMPSDWWLIRDFDNKDGGESDPMHEVVRNMYQLSHFYLVIRLHLPYVLRSSGDDRCEESKATAVHAAREIMSRYIAFRKWKRGPYYCRGVDCLAFVALMVLCLAHIDSQNQSMIRHKALFDHSRPSDRALMERTVKVLGERSDDALATKLSSIIQYLLDAEAASANGTGYNTSASETDDGMATEFDGQFMDAEKAVLQLHLPYFGTISLQRRLASDIPLAEEMLSTQVADQTQSSLTEWDNRWSFLDSSNDAGALDDWTLQSINEGLFGGLLGGLGDVDFDPGLPVDI